MGQQGLQIGPDFTDYKLGKRDCKQGQLEGYQIGAGISNQGKKISNWGKRDYKFKHNISQIRAGITNRCGTILCLDPYKITWLFSAMKQLLEKFHFGFLHVLKFCCTWNKESGSCRLNIVTFRHNIAFMVN